MRRRSRIGPAAFAAGLLIVLIIALWISHSGLWSPEVGLDLPASAPAPRDDPPTLMPSAAGAATDAETAAAEDSPEPEVERGEPQPPSSVSDWHPWEGADDDFSYPTSRVRLLRTDSQVPDELYDQNRVIIRQAGLTWTPDGVRVTGEIITDFEADAVPRDADLPQGQLMGLQVDVELYYYDTVLERSADGENVLSPKLSPKESGRLVEGQMVRAKVVDLVGRYGLARFALPVLTKPLAPGVYRLAARLRFAAQDPELTRAVKWCSDLYGSRSEYDPNTMVVTWHEVMNEPGLHEEVYRFLVETKRELNDVSLLWIGEIYRDGEYRFISPREATEEHPATYMVWSMYHTVVECVSDFENQLDHTDDVVWAELAEKLKAKPKNNADAAALAKLEKLRQKWRAEAEETKARIKRDNAGLIERYGGRTTARERERLKQASTAKQQVLRQIADFQDELALEYWVFIDGFLPYAGFHWVNHPAYLAWDAIDKQDPESSKLTRLNNLRSPAARGLAAKWEERRQQWRFCPPEMTEIAFAYLRAKEETGTFDPDNFVIKSNGRYVLNSTKWRDFRDGLISEFAPACERRLESVDTSRTYAVRVWQDAYQQVIVARDDVLRLPFSWEAYIRTEVMGEDIARVKQDWEDEADALPELHLADCYTNASSAPGAVKNHYDAAAVKVKRLTGLRDFISRYAFAIEAGTTPPGQR